MLEKKGEIKQKIEEYYVKIKYNSTIQKAKVGMIAIKHAILEEVPFVTVKVKSVQGKML